jgi:hypothetical protein
MKAANGQIILTSRPYETKNECLAGIGLLKQHATDGARYEYRKTLNLKHYFDLTDSTGETIGSSEIYESSSGRDTGIELVKSNALIGVIEDLT